MASRKKTLTEEEIREDIVPEGAGMEVPETPENPKTKEPEQPHEPEHSQEPKAARPPKDYIEKALELVKEQREGDKSHELFIVEQSLLEALRFIAKHEKKKGGA